jgi:S1-C subfamily serine protease
VATAERVNRSALASHESTLQQLQRAHSSLAQAVGTLNKRIGGTESELRKVSGLVTESRRRAIDVRAVAAAATPAVVTVNCDGTPNGSGFSVAGLRAPVGYRAAVITNRHVIDDCSDVSVSQHDVERKTTVWKVDEGEERDLALLYVNADIPGLRPAPRPTVGDPVIAIGNPSGYAENTVTEGIVSRLEGKGWVQHSASINPGNSGGPLLDRGGRVVGVNTATLARPDFTRAEGVHFAVLLDQVCAGILERSNCPLAVSAP